MLVQSRLHMLPYIHQMNRVNSRNDRGHDASTIVAVIDGQAYKHRLVFTQKQVLAIVLPNLNRYGYNFAYTYYCTEWADLDRDRRVRGSRPNQNNYVFYTCNAP